MLAGTAIGLTASMLQCRAVTNQPDRDARLELECCVRFTQCLGDLLNDRDRKHSTHSESEKQYCSALDQKHALMEMEIIRTLKLNQRDTH